MGDPKTGRGRIWSAYDESHLGFPSCSDLCHLYDCEHIVCFSLQRSRQLRQRPGPQQGGQGSSRTDCRRGLADPSSWLRCLLAGSASPHRELINHVVESAQVDGSCVSRRPSWAACLCGRPKCSSTGVGWKSEFAPSVDQGLATAFLSHTCRNGL